MIFSLVGGLLEQVIGGVKDHFAGKRRIKEAVVENKIRLAGKDQDFNHEWEMKQLEGAGWKDDILFYFFIGIFIWTGFDPVGGAQFFANLETVPEWFLKLFGWMVAAVLGVKKIGDYLPSTLGAIKDLFKK
jgi:hypothetical protein